MLKLGLLGFFLRVALLAQLLAVYLHLHFLVVVQNLVTSLAAILDTVGVATPP